MFPNKLESVLLVFAFIMVQLFLLISLHDIGITWGDSDPIIFLLVELFSLCVITWFALSKMDLKFHELFHSNQNSISSVISISVVPIAMVVIACQILISNYLNIYYAYFNESDSTKSIDQLMNSGLVGLVSICFIGPVIEEVLFRGIILRGLLANYNKTSALLFSSVLFSIFHLNPDQLVHTFIFGLFLGWVYIITFSLWSAVLAHILFNIVACILATSIIQIEGVNYFPNDGIIFPSLFVQTVAVVLFYYGFSTLKRTFTLNENE